MDDRIFCKAAIIKMRRKVQHHLRAAAFRAWRARMHAKAATAGRMVVAVQVRAAIWSSQCMAGQGGGALQQVEMTQTCTHASKLRHPWRWLSC